MNVITINQFRNMSIRQKGYIVHLYGKDDTQLNIPIFYHPKRRLRARQRNQFILGGQDALIERQRKRTEPWKS